MIERRAPMAYAIRKANWERDCIPMLAAKSFLKDIEAYQPTCLSKQSALRAELISSYLAPSLDASQGMLDSGTLQPLHMERTPSLPNIAPKTKFSLSLTSSSSTYKLVVAAVPLEKQTTLCQLPLSSIPPKHVPPYYGGA
jgi:hypothetical protein